MKRYLLNSAVISNPGSYNYMLVDSVLAREFLNMGGWISRIGYPSTADYIRRLGNLDEPPELSREQVAMEPGDVALVVRLKYRISNPADKRDWEPQDDDFEIGLLTRTA